MTPSTARLLTRLCRLGSVSALAATGAIVYWSLQPPELPSAVVPVRRVAGVPNSPVIPGYEALQASVDQRLRPPLYDPPPPPPAPKPKVEPPPPIRVNLKLVGTVREPGKDRAMLAGPDGSIEFRRIGDEFQSESQTMVVEEVGARDVLIHVTAPRDGTVRLNLEE